MKITLMARAGSLRGTLIRGVLCIVMATLLVAPVWARTGSGKAASSHSSAAGSSHSAKPRSAHPAPSARVPRAKAPSAIPRSKGHGGASREAPGVPRDTHGRIARSSRARSEFEKSHPCPSTGKTSGACPGYVIDHVKPLKRGGADSPRNMQWQTTQAARQKDRVE